MNAMEEEATSQSASRYGPGPSASEMDVPPPWPMPSAMLLPQDASWLPTLSTPPPDWERARSSGALPSQMTHVCVSFCASSAGLVPTAYETAHGPSAMRGMTFHRSLRKASASGPCAVNCCQREEKCGLAARRDGCTA